jgi:DNA-3-methyladenine glycosylase II
MLYLQKNQGTGEIMERISIKGPYNFDQVLYRLALDPLNQIDLQERSVKVPIVVNGDKHVVKVTSTGSTEDPVFEVSDNTNEAVIARIREIFQWDQPLDNIHAHFRKTDLAPIFEGHVGTPLVLDFDPYNCLLKCIVHQQLNLKFAHTLTHRFVTTFGTEVDGAYFYPDPEKLANTKVEELRELQFSGRKAEYAIGVAKAIVEGELNLQQLQEKPDDEIMEELVKLKGIGPWTVQNFLMFGLGRPNLFPIADIGLQNALKKLYNMDRKPTKEEMESYKPSWEPYASYASLYLWRSIE